MISDEEYEEIVMTIIVSSGSARSFAMEAISATKKNDFEKASSLINEAEEALNDAHKVQTRLIQNEAGGEPIPVRLLMVHAQDHLMNAIVVKDLAYEIIELYKKF